MNKFGSKAKTTHMVIYHNTIKFRGSLGECINEKKRLVRIYGNYGLKIVPIADFH
jgi:hypothetical protein